ncbi:tRNA-specific 2-thiouridylase MnmA [Candidatus Vidania fulgoroideae]|nr:tRNA-specific 2-thiouridylase MnmA [Candidatus Vidania fulgoroideae]
MKINLLFSGGIDSTFTMFFIKKTGNIPCCNFIKVCPEINKDINKEIFNCYFLSKRFKSELKIIDSVKKYKKKVFNKMIKEYKRGKTPNPDILCNKEIKFRNYFFKKKINSSGHYTIKKKNKISIPVDFKKDQTYFLSMISKKKIKNTIFPMGVFYKKETIFFVNFLNLNKNTNKSSRGICFLNYKKKFSLFISKFVKKKCKIIYKGKKISEKRIFYKTIGQKTYIEGKGNFYIAKKKRKKIFLVRDKNNTLLYKRIFSTKNFYFEKENKKLLFLAKTSSTSNLSKCFIYIRNNSITIVFIKPIKKISEGQSITFFLKRTQIGYAII